RAPIGRAPRVLQPVRDSHPPRPVPGLARGPPGRPRIRPARRQPVLGVGVPRPALPVFLRRRLERRDDDVRPAPGGGLDAGEAGVLEHAHGPRARAGQPRSTCRGGRRRRPARGPRALRRRAGARRVRRRQGAAPAAAGKGAGGAGERPARVRRAAGARDHAGGGPGGLRRRGRGRARPRRRRPGGASPRGRRESAGRPGAACARGTGGASARAARRQGGRGGGGGARLRARDRPVPRPGARLLPGRDAARARRMAARPGPRRGGRAVAERGARDLRATRSDAVDRAGERSRRPGRGRMTCGSCGAENRAGRKFCAECGSPLSLACPSCGAANEQGDRFCGECGTPLVAPAVRPAAEAAAAERRHVSVLFADLVGFTKASEQRDAEDTRELLSAYFDTCKRLIALYGGTVEKFIGDAVMAVWGTPTANEDDAERAVRAALDLVAAVPDLDPALAARAGVLAGEAAVTLGAEGQGMVAGDLVNTASRIQSAAEPGTVLVGESTKRATEAAIAYEDAGVHELKGKAGPVPLYRALRVTAARAGALKSAAVEPPFVGRERELRLVKELFHASAEEQKAHLVSVVGIAGIGKSRLAWEFEKYIDGLIDDIWWHRGRCLAYGEGVAYWALAEMVRMRARIGEEEPSDEALAKLRAALDEHVPDAEERSWLELRLAHLLGLGEPIAADRQELFSAWRVFFERLADQGPCVLVFEDLQWAEPGLLDFVDHVLEWSRSKPLFVLALVRPEAADRREGAPSPRNATSLSLEPLSAEAMESLLDGFAPGLPAELRRDILARAE